MGLKEFLWGHELKLGPVGGVTKSNVRFFWGKGLIGCNFSSPEPKAHRLAYSLPMVRRPASSVRRRLSSTMLKHLLRNLLADQSQSLCGASLGRGNEILFATCGSRDQDGRQANIW